MADLQPIQRGSFGGTGELAARQNRVLRNTYLLLAVTLIPTIIGAAIGVNLNLSFLRVSPMLFSFAIIGIFYGWIFAIEKNRDSGVGVGLLLGFTLFMGVLLGPLLQHILGFSNGVQLIAMAVGGTAITFFSLAAIASSTKRNFSGLGNFLTVGAIVIMLAVVANIFLASPVLYLVLLGAFVLFSTLMILWQINAIVQGGETNYISATLTLYVQIYNLFSILLQILGFGGRND
jgi:modulator of FtsH protease